MTPAEMKAGIRYLVTHASLDDEFQVGDRIMLCPDGSISNDDACGWMDAADVPAATRGMTVEVDAVWVEARRLRLASHLAALGPI